MKLLDGLFGNKEEPTEDADELGDFGDFDDDDDEFGGLGDFGDDDEFGGLGGGSSNGDIDELEKSVKDLQTEVGSLSSTMSTVRAENGEISEQVSEVTDQVRKLLDIYEMVTRGINPFVDDVGGDAAFGGSMAGGGGNFGLFDGADQSAPEEEDDEELMNADADSFFDDDLLDDGFDDPLEDDVGADLDEEEPMEDTASSGGGAKSFEDLKAEFDAGADWAGDDGDEDESEPESPDVTFEPTIEEATVDTDVEVTEEPAAQADPVDAGPVEEPTEAVEDSEAEPVEEPAETPVEEPDETPVEEDEADDDSTGFIFPTENESNPSDTGKPYLRQLPSNYVGDLIAMDWLEQLYERSDITEAARALYYYETIEWIAPRVTDGLFNFLAAYESLEEIDLFVGGKPTLTTNDHLMSLQYINLLATQEPSMVMLQLLRSNNEASTETASDREEHTNDPDEQSGDDSAYDVSRYEDYFGSDDETPGWTAAETDHSETNETETDHLDADDVTAAWMEDDGGF